MIASVVEPMTAPAALAGDLVMARLLPPTKRPPAPGKVRNDVALFFRERPSDERWQETIDGLVNAALITTRPLGLTEAGRTRGLEFLGISELSPRSTWATIQAKFLVPKALGLAPGDQEMLKRIGRADNLAALLLKRRYKLVGGAGSGLKEVFDALVCRELGFPEAASLQEVRAAVLSGLAKSKERLDDKALAKQLVLELLGARKEGIAGLRETVLHGWVDTGSLPSVPLPSRDARKTEIATRDALDQAEFDLTAFARTVKAAARDCPTGRFGDNKVFIAHAWRRLGDEPGFPAMDLPTFKQRLTEANNAGLLTLSRADLVEVMDPMDVRESETRYLNAEYHFVLLEKEQP